MRLSSCGTEITEFLQMSLSLIYVLMYGLPSNEFSFSDYIMYNDKKISE
jgi:hypothetical protein